MRGFVRPYAGTLEGSAILEGAFAADRLYNFSLWDKLYSAELCKKSFACVQDGEFPKANDKYAYFVLSYFAETYRGLPSERLYNYHFGRGATGRNLLSLSEFEIYCSMALVADAIRDFLETQGDLQRYDELYANVRNELLQDCVAHWTRHLGAQDKAAGFDMMLAYWEAAEVAAKIAQLNWGDQGHVARLLKGSRALSQPVGEVRVVGTYYHRYANGGVQRVISMLIQLWLDLGYEVVLFTDLPPSEHDYHLPEGVQRVVLPSSFDVKKKTYIHRARAIATAMPSTGSTSWCITPGCRACSCGTFSCTRRSASAWSCTATACSRSPRDRRASYFADMPPIYALCDAVIALSEADQAYWANFNDNVTRVVNPLGIDPASIEPSDSVGQDRLVAWPDVGREAAPRGAADLRDGSRGGAGSETPHGRAGAGPRVHGRPECAHRGTRDSGLGRDVRFPQGRGALLQARLGLSDDLGVRGLPSGACPSARRQASRASCTSCRT